MLLKKREKKLKARLIHCNKKIIVYSRNTINAYFFFSHEWWVSLIKFMVGPTIHVRGGSMHLFLYYYNYLMKML